MGGGGRGRRGGGGGGSGGGGVLLTLNGDVLTVWLARDIIRSW